MDANTLFTSLLAGASLVGSKIGEIAGTEVVKEVTKDAYKALKSTLATVCGRKVEYAAREVEADPRSETARAKLLAAIGDIPDPDAEEVEAALRRLHEALQDDPAARSSAAAIAGIRLDVVSGGSVVIERIDGAAGIDVKSRSQDDFAFRDVKMARGPEGN